MAKKSINKKADEILQELKEAEKEVEEIAVEAEETVKASVKKGPKKYKIIIDEQAGPDAYPEVFIGVNGKHYLIKRGHEVIVPDGVVNVLKEAVITKIIKDPETGNETVKKIPRFSYRIIGEV